MHCTSSDVSCKVSSSIRPGKGRRVWRDGFTWDSKGAGAAGGGGASIGIGGGGSISAGSGGWSVCGKGRNLPGIKGRGSTDGPSDSEVGPSSTRPVSVSVSGFSASRWGEAFRSFGAWGWLWMWNLKPSPYAPSVWTYDDHIRPFAQVNHGKSVLCTTAKTIWIKRTTGSRKRIDL